MTQTAASGTAAIPPRSAQPAIRAWGSWRRGLSQGAIWAVLLVLVVISAIISPIFLQTRNVSTLLKQAAPLGILAVGQTLVILTGGIDLSVASVVALMSIMADNLIVLPGFNGKVVDWCQAHKIPAMPGVATPTEILMALGKGINLIKFFPAEALGGVPVLEAIAAAFPGVRFVPTGGITAQNLAAYLKLPMVFACGGTWLVAGKFLNAGAFGEITRLTREAVGIVRSERGPGVSR